MAGGVRESARARRVLYRSVNRASSVSLFDSGETDSLDLEESIMKTAALAVPAARIREDRAISRALRILETRLRDPGQLLTSDSAEQFFALRLAELEHEVFEVAFLDAHHRLIAVETMFRGTIDGAEVHPREVVKQALRHNAAAVIVAHNHPSGLCKHSAADYAVTGRLRSALAIVDVRLLDHILVAGTATTTVAA